MKILIIDDHQLFAAGLKHMLESALVSASAECYENPEQAIANHTVDDVKLIVVDFYIPGFDTIEYIEKLMVTYLQANVVVISSSVSATDRKECLLAGATAYFEKHLPPDVVLHQLKKITEDIEVNNENLSFIDKNNNKYGFGRKKTEVLILLARGYSNKKIASRLGVSPETVKTHLSNIYRTIEVSTRDEAINWACQHGFV